MTGGRPPLEGLAEFIIESALDGMVVIDAEGRIIAFNAAAGRIFGVDPASMIGGNLEPLFIPGLFVEHQRYIQDYLRGAGRGVVGSIIETEGWHSAGRAVPIEISLCDGKLDGQVVFLACIRDITRRREDSQQQRALRQLVVRAQRIESLGTISAGIAHDFANTLGAIMGFASALLNELVRSDPHYADVAQILALSHRARRLTESLLSFSGGGPPSSEPVAINGAVRSVLSMFRRSIPRRIRVKLRLGQGVLVEGDAPQLEQCLMNLCLNARDAMPDGGELTVETRRLELDASEAAAQDLSPGPHCLIVVRDNGVGMDQATLQRVGQPFFSTKPTGRGRGLGLSVVQSVAQAHGGTVRFRSEVGRGTEVRVLLPASAQTVDDRAVRSGRRGATPRGHRETILIADDDRPLRQMADRLLGSMGYQVLLAGSGEEALRLYGEQNAGIDLVIMDLRLPDTTAAEVLGRLQQIDPAVRVVISSGLMGAEEMEELRQLGACGFLSKPYGLEEISDAIADAISPGE